MTLTNFMARFATMSYTLTHVLLYPNLMFDPAFDYSDPESVFELKFKNENKKWFNLVNSVHLHP